MPGTSTMRTLGETEVDFEVRHGTRDAEIISEVWDLDTYGWPPGMVAGRQVLDLGANIGAFALWATAAGARAVRAVEPEPSNLNALRTNLGRNKHLAWAIEVWPLAASTAETVDVHADGASSWTTPARVANRYGVVVGADMEVLLAGLGDDVVVKCDIEGGEFPLFAAATDDDLRRIDHLVLEWHAAGMGGPLATRTWGPHDFGDLVSRLAMHHQVCTWGRPDRGGIIHAERY